MPIEDFQEFERGYVLCQEDDCEDLATHYASDGTLNVYCDKHVVLHP